jgi:hypothetical protein
VISLNDHNIILALKENAIHRRSKPEDPSTTSNPHRFGLSTDNPYRHCQKEEAVPHLHTEKQQEQKLERQSSARLIQGEQKITTRYAKALNKANNS